jgi:hypothetical protein
MSNFVQDVGDLYMSLLSKQLGIISLGTSCQVAHNLRLHVGTLRQELGIADLTKASSYFDYIVTPVPALLSFLKCFESLERLDEIILYQNPYWRTKDVWFTHNFRAEGRPTGSVDIPGRFEEDRKKISYMRSKFLNLSSCCDKFAFVIGNTQQNILTSYPDRHLVPHRFHFSADCLARCGDLLRASFGSRFHGILAIECNETFSGDWSVPGVTRQNYGASDVDWKGNPQVWREMLVHGLRSMLTCG